MPQPTTYGPFDLTFDSTFQYLLPVSGVVDVPDCQSPGVSLCWLSPVGWAYYTFGGNSDTDVSVAPVATYQQGGHTRDTQRIANRVLTLRAGNLTEFDAGVVSTVMESTHVYAMVNDSLNRVRQIPVYIEPGELPIWRESQTRIGIEFKLRFPARKSART